MKILIAATPKPGHLNPLLAIAHMAKGRGDDVVVTTAQALAPEWYESGITNLELERNSVHAVPFQVRDP